MDSLMDRSLRQSPPLLITRLLHVPKRLAVTHHRGNSSCRLTRIACAFAHLATTAWQLR